jgi:hypothetical protein
MMNKFIFSYRRKIKKHVVHVVSLQPQGFRHVEKYCKYWILKTKKALLHVLHVKTMCL